MSSQPKIIIFLGDGVGDRPVPELDGRTPLEAQATPHLDHLAAGGVCGMLNPISHGRRVGSDTAHMAILGYDPFSNYKGRGPFEAKGVGIDVLPGDLAFRCNFSTVEGRRVTDRRAGRISSGTDELAKAVNEQAGLIDGVQCIFRESVEHRAALVMRGADLDHRITEVDPHHEGAEYPDCAPLPEAADDPNAIRTAAIVNKWVQAAHAALDSHPVNQQRRAAGLPPANIALPRGVGTAVHLEPFAKRYGLKGAMIVEVDLVRGLGLYLGMTVVDVPEATGGKDTDELAISRAVVAALDSHDFVLANIKAPDLAGHDHDAAQKMGAIAKLDSAVGYLLEHVDFECTTILVTGDHCTPVTYGDHTGDAVPAVFYGLGVRPDNCGSFGERTCMQGGLGYFTGFDVMPLLTNLAGVQAKFGA
ncbi:MAG: 2,3-bisphosphoglycerate-independent phosphoglycerate mutase [Armatimonadetes bacterium]|nr:2,3-bisphosphoglycerate-independent phosphoglycerate mutase [Armatimonadota bacterium]